MVKAIKILSLLFCLCFSILSRGATETYSSRISGTSSIAANAVHYAMEGSYLYMLNNTPAWQTEFTNQSANAYIELGWDEAMQTTQISSYEYKVNFEIIGYDEYGIPSSPITDYLVISYDESSLIDRSKDVLSLNGYHNLKIKVVSIVDATSGSPVTAPDNMYIETRFVIERYYDFPETSQHNYSNVNHTVTANNELEINWTYLAGAEEYELEWTYINNYDADYFATSQTIAAGSLLFNDRDFELNNTRIRTGFNKYVIPLTYDKGFIVYRVRGIGRDIFNLSHIIYGKWSEKTSSRSDVDDYAYYTITTAHDPDKNWQYQANYAEEGKKKEVISYFDGSLRNRQSLTRLNTNKKSIVGETIYDHQGRPSIQTLPVPTNSSELKYLELFNRNNLGVNGYPYSKLDFDKDASCVVATSSMNTISGSSNYYSDDASYTGTFQDLVPNAFGYPFTQTEYEPDNTGRIRRQSGVGDEHKLGTGHETMYFYGKPHQEELDRLFGYHVGYKSRYKKNMVVDPNGQVSITYIDHQGRTIATALAGDNPTALEVVADEFGVNALPNSISLSVDILNKVNSADKDTPQDDNMLFNTGNLGPSDDGLTVSLQENVPLSGSNYTFDYELIPPAFTDGCLDTKCYPIVYDVNISVLDKCGEDVLVNNTISEVSGTVDLTGSGCSPSSYTPSSSLLASSLAIGTYSVSKKISVNESALDQYTSAYIAEGQSAGCIMDSSDFYEIYIETADTNCEVSCTSCLDSLLIQLGLTASSPTQNEWDDIWTDNYVNPSTQNEYDVQAAMQDAGLTQYLWSLAYDECTAACTSKSLCESAYEVMLLDVSPGGLYAAVSNTYNLSVLSSSSTLELNSSNVTDPWRNPTTWFDFNANSTFDVGENTYLNLDGTPATVAVFPDPNSPGDYMPEVLGAVTPISDGNGGFYVYPHELLNMLDFAGIFDTHWAEALVEYHPEYCYYEKCIEQNQDWSSGVSNYDSSHDFDVIMNGITTLSAAATEFGFSSNPHNEEVGDNMSGIKDPYFAFGDSEIDGYTYSTSTSTASYSIDLLVYAKNRMNDALGNYQGSGSSMWEVAAIAASSCASWYGQDVSSCTATVDDDLAWNNFKSYYLSEKQKIQADIADFLAKDGGCYNNWIALKNRRFPNVNSINQPSNMNEVENDMDYKAWLQTGQCPNAFDLQLLLSTMAYDPLPVSGGGQYVNLLTSGNSSTPNQKLLEMPGFTASMYKVISELNPDNNNYVPYEWDADIAGTNNEDLNIDFTNGTIASTYSTCLASNSLIELTLVDNSHFSLSTYNWNNYGSTWKIRQFDKLTATSDHDFKVLAYVEVSPFTSSTLTEVLLEGYTCLSLSGCEGSVGNDGSPENANANNGFNNACPPSYLVDEIGKLFNRALNAGELDATGHDLLSIDSDFGDYSTLVGELGLPTTVTLSGTGTSYDINGDIAIDFLSSLPSNIVSFSDFNPIDDYTIEVTVTSSTQTPTALPVDMTVFPLAIETQTIQFELHDISGGTPGNPIIVTDCCKDKEEVIEPIVEDTLYSQRRSVCTNICVDHIEVIQSCMDVEVKIVSMDPDTFCPFLYDVTTWTDGFEVNYGDGTVINTGLLVDALTHTYTNSTVQSYTIKVKLFYGQYTPAICDKERHDSLVTIDTEMIIADPICLPCEGCIPFNEPLVDCYSSYEDYIDYMEAETVFDTTVTDITNPADEIYYPYYYITEEEYCTGGYKYSWPKYQEYFDDLVTGGITNPYLPDANNPYFISFNDFVLNGYELYVPHYITYIDAIGYPTTSSGNGYISLADFATAQYSATCVADFIAANTSLPTTITTPIDEVCEDYDSQSQYCTDFIVPKWPELPETKDPCVVYMQNMVAANADEAYSTYINGVTEDFRERYIKFAVENAVETFTMTHPDQEYHYTLYYYDQGGNLTNTYPPRGVHRLDLSASFTNSFGATNIREGIKTARANKDLLESPSTTHNYITKYVYNTLNQLIGQHTPDGGTTSFWYDHLGRMVASQNAEQAIDLGSGYKRYSYTRYDVLGRIEEVGQLVSNTAPEHLYELTGTPTSSDVDFTTSNYPYNGSWPNVTTIKQVTRTFYDEVTGVTLPSGLYPNGQENLRNRVVRSTYQDEETDLTGLTIDLTVYDNATHYSYDVHGNVKILVQENQDQALVDLNHQFKKIEYTYDLISGNVLHVDYQDGEADAFYHKYEYDADNRITNAWTSEDGVLWEQDAKYFYYEHGPLARTEIATDKVQGIDYAYTIQGWLKSKNGTVVNEETEMGKDGKSHVNNINLFTGTDAYAFGLSYFNDDYEARIAGANDFTNDLFTQVPIPSTRQLYNGNISQIAVALKDQTESTIPLMANNYTYDQLNRIKTMTSYMTSSGSNDLYANTTSTTKYNIEVEYDPNGNIINLDRNEDSGAQMDDMKYYYYRKNGSIFDPENTNPSNATNQLAYVYDNPALSSVSITDIDNQSTYNYTYDKIGNLKSDVSEGIVNIIWTVYGKIKAISKGGTNDLEFVYDAGGNRITKILKPTTVDPTTWLYTYYVRDASGNVMATYDYHPDDGVDPEELKLNEHYVYGSSRVALVEQDKKLIYEEHNFDSELHGWYGLNTSPVVSSGKMEVTTNGLGDGAFYDITTVPGETYTVNIKVEPGTFGTGFEVWDAGYTIAFDNVHMGPTGNYSLTFTASTIVSHIKLYTYTGLTDLFKVDNVIIKSVLNTDKYFLDKGKRNFELSNHLGNVMSVVTDKKIPVFGGYSTVVDDNYDSDLNGWTSNVPGGIINANGEMKVVTLGFPAQFDARKINAPLINGLSYTISFDVVSTNTSTISFLINGVFVHTSTVGVNSFSYSATQSNNTLQFTNFSPMLGDQFIIDNFKVVQTNSGLTVKNFEPNIISYNDYYPFGSLMPGRYTGGNPYRYGFQGQEGDPEVKGEGNSVNYKFRMYDPRLGRFFAVDPLSAEYPWYTPYSFAGNKVVQYVELEGLEEGIPGTKDGSVMAIDNTVTPMTIPASEVVTELNNQPKGIAPTPNQLEVFLMTPILNLYEFITGEDPETGEEGNRFKAGVNLIRFKGGKGPKGPRTKFNSKTSTNSFTTKEGFRKAKDANGVARSAQPDNTYTVPEKGTGKPLKQMDFTNSNGKKVSIRKDNPKKYNDGGKGDQGLHFNAGPKGQKLKQHHNVGNKNSGGYNVSQSETL